MPTPKVEVEGSNLIIDGQVRGCFWLGGESLHNDPQLAMLVASLLQVAIETTPNVAQVVSRESVSPLKATGLLDSPRFNKPVPTPEPPSAPIVIADGNVVDIGDGEIAVTVERMENDSYVGQAVRVIAG